MNNTEFAKKLIMLVPFDQIDKLLDLSKGVSRLFQTEIAKHVRNVAKDSIIAKTEVRDDKL